MKWHERLDRWVDPDLRPENEVSPSGDVDPDKAGAACHVIGNFGMAAFFVLEIVGVDDGIWRDIQLAAGSLLVLIPIGWLLSRRHRRRSESPPL